MPANLTPQYLEAEQRYKSAQTPADKIVALRNMMAVIPKHKGTEKLRAEIRRKLSRVQSEVEAERQRRAGGRPSLGYVKHEGAGQVLLLGAPNTGKSALLAALTNAHPKVADYPFTTLEPLCGMMDFEDIQVQLVDAPGVSAEFMEPWYPELVRNADRALLVANLGSDTLLEDTESVVRRLAEKHIQLVPLNAEQDSDEVDCVETLCLGTQADREGATERLELLRQLLADLVSADLVAQTLVVSATREDGIEALRRRLFEALRVIRIYTKTPGHPADLVKPFVVPSGSTVADLASVIHKDLAATMRFARVWGSAKFEGQSVQQDHVLQDRDVIEIHT